MRYTILKQELIKPDTFLTKVEYLLDPADRLILESGIHTNQFISHIPNTGRRMVRDMQGRFLTVKGFRVDEADQEKVKLAPDDDWLREEFPVNVQEEFIKIVLGYWERKLQAAREGRPYPKEHNTTFTKRVGASVDDMEENVTSGTNDDISSDIEICYDGFAGWVGFRFLNVTIPQGSTIDAAKLTVHGDENRSIGTVTATIYCRAADNCPAYVAGTSAPLSGLARTTASASWTVAGSSVCTNQDSADFKTVLQEVTDRAGWASGNALGVLLNSSNAQRRTFTAWDLDTTQACLLTVDYTAAAAAAFKSEVIIM